MMRRQTWTAVALLLLIATLALGCGANQLIARAPTPTATPTKTPKPTFTPTTEPTNTPVLTDTPEPTATPVPTDTPEPEPTATSAPTDTPVPPTATPRPTTPPQPRVQPTSPPPPPTAPPPPPPPSDPFKGTLVKWEPNCAGNQVKGLVKTSTGGLVDSGVVKIFYYGNVDEAKVGYGMMGAGGWDWPRWGQGLLKDPITVAYYANDGTRVSNEVVIPFDTGPCEPGGSGHQVATVEFICVRPDICG